MNLACSILPDQSFLVARQAHHIYETAKMIKAGLEPLDGPCTILSKELHQQFTKELAAKTAGITQVGDLWRAYKTVYAARPEWLKAIAHYFGE
ncbi:hypothetical protein [Polyangium fumosum]|uniref:Uncharacterized protein n=1 Tax=Polyangium fumosum TaxID=889272 RepID=A0A4U1J3Z8_9BACT|nr:hypothetical protein [Polyangium fumosum]TKD01875.1 hypothetical protein E8A74_30315 [Polyangium fumosum]